MSKKSLIALFLCIAMTATTFTGCSSSDSKKKETKQEKTQKADPFIKDAASYIELAEYKTIELKTTDIEEQLESTIQEALDAQAAYKEIKKGKVKSGDTVNIYYVGKMDGVAFEGGSCTKEDTPDGYNLTIGSNTFIDGFEDALIGKTIGKTYDINVTFPENYSANTELAGKPAVFTVTINYKQGAKIKQKLTEKFVKKYLTDYKSVKDYKTKTRESIVRTMAIEKVCTDTKVNKYPEDRLSAMETQLKTSVQNYLTQSGMSLEDYLTNIGTTEEEYKEQVTATGKEEVRNILVFNAIAQAENIEVTEDEYKKEVENYVSSYGVEDEKALDETFQSTYGASVESIIYNNMLYEKVADYVVKNVKES